MSLLARSVKSGRGSDILDGGADAVGICCFYVVGSIIYDSDGFSLVVSKAE